jgi:predicted transcriptional regulator
MPTDKALVSVYVPKDIKEKLEVWASEEDRSVSYIVGKLIVEAIEVKESKKNIPHDAKDKGDKGGA